MSAEIIDGFSIARDVREKAAAAAAELKVRGVTPCLAVILVGEDPASISYVTGKQILKLLQDTSRETGMTVVIITHNSALTAMADRVIKVKNGTVVSQTLNEKITPVEEIEW